MAQDSPAQRLQWARKQHGQYGSPTDAARAFGWPVSTYLGHENADRNPSRAAAKRYAKAYGVRWEWLLENEGAPLAGRAQAPITVPLISWVSAGDLANAETQIPLEEAPLLTVSDLGAGEFFGLRVEGDSMDRWSPPGSIIIVNRNDRELIAGKGYIFDLRGDTTYKRWQPEPPRLEPHSTNPAHQAKFIRRKKDLEVIGRVIRTVLDL